MTHKYAKYIMSHKYAKYKKKLMPKILTGSLTWRYPKVVVGMSPTFLFCHQRRLTLIHGFLGPSPSVIIEKKIQNYHW